MTHHTKNKFRKELNRRHILFIGIGAGIGTGLFLGSATAIQQAGPSVLLAYLLCGLAAFFVMRAMGDMSLQSPHLGTFGSCTAHYLSPFAGFTAGWSYVLQMVFVCLADITAFATYMGFWYPTVSPWIWTLALALLICALNLSVVKVFGELEFWFTAVKVTAILVMIIGGIYLLSIGFNSPARTLSDVHNLFSFKYWFPYGFWGLIKCLPIVFYSFGGIEVLGITSSEADNAKVTLPKAINAIPLRILFFYVMTLGVLLALYPWQQIGVNGSPFVIICSALGIKSAANLLNILVIVAAISAINSDIYGSSRMIYSLSRDGLAFKHFNRLGKTGTPVYAIFLMVFVLISGIIFNYFDHEGLFVKMADLAAVSCLISWILIVLAQYNMRKKMTAEEVKNDIFPMPLWPLSSLITFLFLLFIFIVMLCYNLSAFIGGVIWIVYLAVMYFFIKRDKEGKLVQKVTSTANGEYTE